jgi:Leucine-rich repeat (LRR) protein
MKLWQSGGEDWQEARRRIAEAARTSATALDLSGLTLDKVPPELGKLHWLRELVLIASTSGSWYKDLSTLAGLTGLRKLHLQHSQVTDVSALSRLVGLEELFIIDTPITDATPLACLRNLHKLNLMETGVADLEPLAELRYLRTLGLAVTPTADLGPLAGLTNLRDLYIWRTRVSNLEPLANLTSLEYLDLSETPVIDLKPLTRLTSLRSLKIERTEVADLTPVADLVQLAVGARDDPLRGGLKFAQTPAAEHDPVLAVLARLDDPERTERTLDHLRSKIGLPPVVWALGEPLEVEPQSNVAARFRTVAGKIDVDVDAGREQVQDDAHARERHAEVRRQVMAVLERCAPDGQPRNLLAELQATVSAYDEALGRSLPELRPSLLVLRGDALRVDLEVDARRGRDAEPDVPPWDAGLRGAVEKLVAAHNLLVGCDESLARMDEVRLGPDRSATPLADPDDAVARVLAAVEAGVATPDAAALVELAARNADAGSATRSRRKLLLAETVRNFARAVLHLFAATVRWTGARVAMPLVEEAAKGTGKTVGTLASLALCGWLAANAGWLQGLFAHNPAMSALIRRLVDTASKLVGLAG